MSRVVGEIVKDYEERGQLVPVPAPVSIGRPPGPGAGPASFRPRMREGRVKVACESHFCSNAHANAWNANAWHASNASNADAWNASNADARNAPDAWNASTARNAPDASYGAHGAHAKSPWHANDASWTRTSKHATTLSTPSTFPTDAWNDASTATSTRTTGRPSILAPRSLQSSPESALRHLRRITDNKRSCVSIFCVRVSDYLALSVCLSVLSLRKVKRHCQLRHPRHCLTAFSAICRHVQLSSCNSPSFARSSPSH